MSSSVCRGTGGGKGHHSFLSDLVGDGGDRILTSNAIHLVGLTADSIVVLNGGLRHLLAHSSDHAANRKVCLIKTSLVFQCLWCSSPSSSSVTRETRR